MDQIFLSPDELLERWRNRVEPRTLENWRTANTGPRYTKVGGKILYSIEEVEKYEKEQLKGGKG